MKVQAILLFLTLYAAINAQLDGFTNPKSCQSDSYYAKYRLAVGKSRYETTNKHFSAYSLDACRSYDYTENSEKCCYLKYTFNSYTYYTCIRLSLEQFYDIDTVISNIENDKDNCPGCEVKELLCDSSSYLYSSLALILLLLF